ncbi:MAG TPA: hypothetical protein VJ023_03760 [Pyrinomonadaceae bacterium]|nr:hypothetical protein [Pyrinomonadaceae bacterium]
MRKNHLINIPENPKFIGGVHSYYYSGKIAAGRGRGVSGSPTVSASRVDESAFEAVS